MALTITGHRVVRMGMETGEELVCILFSDLVGWTAMNDRLGDDAADALRRRHFTDLRSALRSHWGREIKSVGDGMMAVFRGVVDALACAADIEELAASAGVKIRIGIHAGEPWAHLCGVSPIEASSGKVTRRRLNRSGDRQANHALWRIAITRMGSDPRTRPGPRTGRRPPVVLRMICRTPLDSPPPGRRTSAMAQ